MKIESFSDLEKAFKLARKHGVDSLKVDNLEFKLGHPPDAPIKQAKPDKELVTVSSPTTLETNTINIKTWEQMTDEEKLFYSVQEAYIKNSN